ncbi:hypothetical protein [Streptomyces sp. NBC_01320]|uniref:hypothetical protein n=1 Tax=Streptomyces sp. NBC_01320 TaxID=2903824 RepID=UPI002E1365A8|nr:hypothetical protein OG395_13575 [Streptomyces sp. NBC_01320]
MRGGIGDVVRGGVCLLLAAVLLGAAWPLWQRAERLRADDVDFAKVAVIEDGHPTDQLKVCGDHYRKPYCMQRERVTVRDTDYELKRASTVYTLELTRADKRAMELRYRDHRSHEERDSVYGRARTGEPVTLLWWRGSVRMIQAGEGDDTATVRTGHYPGRLFSGPAALTSALCGIGLGPLWAALWLLLRGRRNPLTMAWQWLAPALALGGAGGVGALVALIAPRPEAVVRGFAVAAVALLVPTLLWLRWWTRTRLPRKCEVEPVEPVEVHAVDGAVAGTGPWKLDIKGPLYVGPGVLGTTPDPCAKVALKPLPGPLRVLAVRPPFRSDPRAVRRYSITPYMDEESRSRRPKGRYQQVGAEATHPLVAVCEVLDGPGRGSRVLIGAPEQDMPEVLGAIAAHARRWR